jgi:hypothetical protein
MLVLIDPKRGPAEALLAEMRTLENVDLPLLETFGTVHRALYLQKMGLIPESIAIQPYVTFNKAKGISEATIMNALLLQEE